MNDTDQTEAATPTVSIPLSEHALKQWMVNYISQLLSLERESISTSDEFDVFGMDSIEAVVMAGIMEEEFGVPIEPTLLLEYPSIDLFAAANSQES